MQVFAFYYHRHQEALFTRPQSMDNMRKSKSIFPVDVRLTLKIRLSIIHLKCWFVCDKVIGVQGWRSGESTRFPPMWRGSIPRSGVICGLSLLVVFSATRGFLRVFRFPLSSKKHHLTWFVLIVNLNLQCPQLARTTRHLKKVPFLSFLFHDIGNKFRY